MIDCLLIVVSYRTAPDISALLATVPASAGDLSWQTVIVNNEPADDLTDLVAPHRAVRLIEAGANLGYAGGINLGVAAASPSRWTVFLNPDLRLAPGALAVMARAADGAHAVVPRMVDAAGALQQSLRREPTILGALGDALFGDRWRGRPLALSEIVRSPRLYEHPGPVDWATGAALLAPTALARDVGEWDTRFFLYSEETDYCRRLRAAGSEILFVPHAQVTHRGGGSGSSDALHALQEVNRVRYFRKWHSTPAAAAFTAVAILNSLLRCHRPRSRAALRALLWPRARAALPGGAR